MENQESLVDKFLTAIPEKLFDRVENVLPRSWQSEYRYRRSKRQFNRYMREHLGGFMVEVEPGPMGSEEIIMKTAVLTQEEAAWSLNPHNYFEQGYRQLRTWFEALAPFRFNVRTVGAVLELGCGSARLIRHLRCMAGTRLVGCDLVPSQIEWCKANIPGVEFYVNDLQPPLTFAADNSFDLAYAASVFTHIPLETQALWIKEMHRILRPGGFLVCDVLGSYHQRRMLDQDDLQKLKRDGNLTITAQDKKASLSTQLIGSWDVFMTRAEFLRAFRKEFEVLDYLPAHLDLFLLRKPLATY